MEADQVQVARAGAEWSPRRKFLAFCAYFLFTVLFFEVVLRSAYSVEPFMVRTIGNDPLSWRRLWVWAQKKTGERLIFPTETYDPILGWRNVPGLVDVPLSGDYRVSTNTSGFRSLQEVSEVKTSPRILLLGDSYTFGDQANDEELFSSVLQDMLEGVEVINMGVRGYGHDQMLLQFEEIGVGLEPDIVILGFLTMDMDRNLLDFRNFSKPKFDLEGGELVLTNSPVPSPEEILAGDWKRLRLYDLWVFFDHVIAGYSGEKAARAEEVTGFILKDLADSIIEAGAVPVFFYFPSDHDIRAYPATPEGEVYLESFCSAYPATICSSAWDEFATQIAAGVQYRQLGHWDAAGHRTAAEAIYNLILEKNLVP